MSHWPVVPILLPLVTAALLLLAHRASHRVKRALGISASLALVAVAVHLVGLAGDDAIRVYQLGNWPSNVGIVLVVDRLSALMVLLTALLGLVATLLASAGTDARQAHFHALLQFQLMGLCGAFLTGDLFNLFVFFEVLLIASYGLLVHDANRERLARATHYVVFNLVGSALFLIAVALLYGVVGTLNMADLARKIALAPAGDVALIQSAGLLLLGVFAIKAALAPLYLWLPRTYAAVTPAVAALFAIMTKVGVYAVFRVYSLIFGVDAGALAGLAQPWVLIAGLATLVLASLGAIAASGLRGLVAYLVIASAGLLLVAFGAGGFGALSAAIYYLTHSTLFGAALFVIADLIARRRGDAGDALSRVVAIGGRGGLGIVFIIGALAIAGVPPLSGFIGKIALLDAVAPHPLAAWIWTIVLATTLLNLFALARAGSALFWRGAIADLAMVDEAPSHPQPSWRETMPLALLLTLGIALAVLADPALDYAESTAVQLLNPERTIDAVLGQQPVARPSEASP